uniref:Uncharacterized protein n=1 Tax=Arabidopsis thaliana TaxID=3702 RepID=Q56ZZ3_ARATH|nr:hypothetical protein [Arabidopsis thaliana]
MLLRDCCGLPFHVPPGIRSSMSSRKMVVLSLTCPHQDIFVVCLSVMSLVLK